MIADGDTGDMIELNDTNGDPAFDIALEIIEASPRGSVAGYGSSPWYDGCCGPEISASLADYIAIVDTGVIHVEIPPSVMNTLRGRTYNVYLTISPIGEDDTRQLLIGRLPVFWGGRNT